MFKLVLLLKRKPGMSPEEFRDYYETRHAVLGARMAPLARRYIRNYLHPLRSNAPAGTEPPYDCITELWFDSEDDFRRSGELVAAMTEELAAITADEENLFDRSKICWFTTTQGESVLDTSGR